MNCAELMYGCGSGRRMRKMFFGARAFKCCSDAEIPFTDVGLGEQEVFSCEVWAITQPTFS
jgi:hypothetical protein